ncbi:LLM class F420-dependent oxidoreductase [Amycolatopsis acidiphila]|uniref:LLM class F420-dependent oxidoreductase n=1 Tax=Amycolatopsis acidiphila TaxID=715473 RepID=A0A558AP56_9PSEU|nr:LLM class F420-dependent oxidoreductase [Amycolatopsis acidiphila]TVT26044.1 LLM class F420-dependent oxidoreductase [Amycolatopsis acidiphila]UIJ63236.1 LLM class F420-dependent oxidoreductase [Amycolatopsis acidiphila]GHG74523.1 LLM class F420-dependent oxidoreductase [Amycolatopsis acidiphila]
MRFNLMFPMRAVKHYEAWRGDGDLGTVARIAEEAGFDGFSMSDHPFPEQNWLSTGGHHAFDPFVSLGFVAASTRRIKLLTYVLVGGYRNPYLSAKAIASLDVLSRGRMIVGMGAGYLRPEFEVLGADFEARGKTLEASIPAMRAAWAGLDHPGPAFPAEGHTMLPAPVQPAGPPIWIGGNSVAARRRAVTLADGWIPMGQSREVAKITGTPALETVSELAAQVRAMQDRRTSAGQSPLDVSFVPFESEQLRHGDAGDFATQVRKTLDAYADAGVSWITIEPASRGLEAFRRDVGRIGELLVSPAR